MDCKLSKDSLIELQLIKPQSMNNDAICPCCQQKLVEHRNGQRIQRIPLTRYNICPRIKRASRKSTAIAIFVGVLVAFVTLFESTYFNKTSITIECVQHRRIADFNRREGSGSGRLCNTNETSGWTRFIDQAGTAIINRIPQSGLRLLIPAGSPCARIATQPVQVTHCGHFLVFNLPVAPECPLRACTIDYDVRL